MRWFTWGLLGLGLLGCAMPQCTGPKTEQRGEGGVGSEGAGAGAAASGPKAERAVLASDEGLLSVPLDGSAPEKLSGDVASWCALDGRGEVLWWLSAEEGSESFVLKVQRLGRREGAQVVARGLPALDLVVIDLGTAGRLGGQDGVAFQVGARLDLSGPKLEALIGCDGDGAYYCFESMEDEDPKKWPLKADLAERRDAIEKIKLENLPLLRELGADQAPLWREAPAKGQGAARVEIPTDGCETPEDCGEAALVPGTPLWTVTVSSSRGDFYHATRQLYDPRTKRFFDPLDPEKSSPSPLKDGGIEEYFVSPSGRGFLQHGAVVDLAKGRVWDREGALACGWREGGWHDLEWPYY